MDNLFQLKEPTPQEEIPRAYSLTAGTCSNPECHRIHLLFYDENNIAICEWVIDEEELNEVYINLKTLFKNRVN